MSEVSFNGVPLTNTIVFTISRDQAIMFGHEKPTAEEVARYNADARERWEQSVKQWRLLDAAASELDAIADPLARKILDLHGCDPCAAECVECSEDGEESYPVSWPCETVTLIAAHFGVEMPSGYFGSRPDEKPHEMPPEGYRPFAPPRMDAFVRAFDEATLHGVDETGAE